MVGIPVQYALSLLFGIAAVGQVFQDNHLISPLTLSIASGWLRNHDILLFLPSPRIVRVQCLSLLCNLLHIILEVRDLADMFEVVDEILVRSGHDTLDEVRRPA